MARVEFGAVSVEELCMLDRVNQYGDNLNLNDEMHCTAPTVVDESAAIDELCEATKAMLGPEITRGFHDAVHLMKFIVGEAEMPQPIDWPTGGVREVERV